MAAPAMSVAPTRTIAQVGDIWESFTSGHKGWRIRITKVGQAAVEYQLLKSHGATQREGRGFGRRWKLLKDVLFHDFSLIQPGSRMTAEQTPTPTPDLHFVGPVLPAEPGIPARSVGHKICTQCGVLKPLTDFDHYTGKAALAQPEGRLGICHPCVVQKRTAGIRTGFERRRLKKEQELTAQVEAQQAMIDRELAAIEEREQQQAAALAAAADDAAPIVLNGVGSIAPPEPVPPAPAPPTPTPNPTPGQRTSIAMALLGLAAEVDAVEHPPAYRQLWSVVTSALQAGTEAGVVFVIPADNYMALMIALEGADKDFVAPQAPEPGAPSPNGGGHSESNWRKILADMKVKTPGA